MIPIEVVFATETLDAGDAGYGALLASWGAGMVVGGLAFAALRRTQLRILLPASTLAIGCAYLATGAAPTLLAACVASAVGGAGNGIQWVALITAVQQLTRADYQARVISLLESLAAAMPGLGFVIGGAVAAIFSPRTSFAVAGAGVLGRAGRRLRGALPGEVGAASRSRTSRSRRRPCCRVRRRPERPGGPSSSRRIRRRARPDGSSAPFVWSNRPFRRPGQGK